MGEVLGRVIGGNVMDGKPKGEVGFDSYYNSTKGGGVWAPQRAERRCAGPPTSLGGEWSTNKKTKKRR